jgi:hypothetical protein
MFKGQSCFPISPVHKDENTVNMQDQIFKIVERFPDLNPKIDYSHIACPDQMSYIESVESST